MGLMSGYDGALPNPRGVKLTYDDFVLFTDDGLRHELIDGEHYVTPSPNDKPQTILVNLLLLIGPWVRAHATGKVWLAPFDAILSPSDVVEPDLLYVSNERRAQIVTAANVQGTPELVVEIGSPGTRRRDETTKRALYERAGVSEYWVVDTEREVVRVYRRFRKRFAPPEDLSLKAGDVLRPPLLQGLELPISEIFRE